MMNPFGGDKAGKRLAKLRKLLGQMREANELGEAELEMILRTIRLGQKRASDVMIPRGEIGAIDLDSGEADAVHSFHDEAVSRLVVTRGGLDHVVGILYARDWLSADDNEKIEDVLRPAMFVSENLPVVEVIRLLKVRRLSIAICMDEFGGTSGLITVTDIVESVFGDFEDEFDRTQAFVLASAGSDGGYLLDARMPLERFSQRFGHQFAEQETEAVETIGGWITQKMERIPAKGESLDTDLGRFEIAQAEPRSIVRLRFYPIAEAQPSH